MNNVKGIKIELSEKEASEIGVASRLVGVLINEGLTAKQAINILDEAKDIFLDRSYHIASK